MNTSVSEHFFFLKNMLCVRSKAYLIPYLCKFLSSIANVARLRAKHQFLFILYVLNVFPNKFVAKFPYISSNQVLRTQLEFLQLYNFALYIQNLNIQIQRQVVIHNNNLHSWCMFLDAEVATKLLEHVKVLFSQVYENESRKYRKRIAWMLSNNKKKNHIQVHNGGEEFPVKSFPFFDKNNPPPPMKSSLNQKEMSAEDLPGNQDNDHGTPPREYNRDQWFVNLSKREVKKEEKEILEKGFKFAFRNHQVNGIDFYEPIETVLKKVSDLTTQNILRSQFTNLISKHQRRRPSREYNYACNVVRYIKKDKRITLLNADKGNSLVMLDRQEYNAKMLDYLNNENMFTFRSSDPTLNIKKQIKRELSDLKTKKQITHEMYQKCLPSSTDHAPSIFAQIKLHKPDRPLRPIINGKNNPTKNISRYLANFLKIFIPFFQFSLKNTSDFVSKLKGSQVNLTSSVLVSFDVTNMYNSIPLDLITDAINFFIDSYNIPLNLSKDVLIKLTRLVTQNSYCKFGANYYLQKRGLAMGSSLSPILANMTMSFIEISYIAKLSPRPGIWYRYVDDVFSIWTGTLDELKVFLARINDYNPDIQFTMEIGGESINYLDISVYHRDNELMTKIYRKPTFSARYLGFNSCHPKNTKLGIARNLFSRAIMYTSDASVLRDEIRTVSNILAINDYPRSCITKALLMARNRTANSHSSRVSCNDNSRWITIDYIPFLSEEIGNRLRKLGYSVAYRPKITLADLYFKESSTDHFPDLPGVIYMISCQCGQKYIGETGRRLQDRIKEHKRYSDPRYRCDPTLKYKSAVAHHIAQTGHTVNWESGVQIIDREKSTNLRKIKESYYIKTLVPKLNFSPGLMISDQWYWVLNRSCQYRLQ